jgi:sugar lactone lactonase YvrE
MPPVSSAISVARRSTGDLLYVVNTHPNAVLYLRLSDGKVAGKLSSIGRPRSVCSDPHGNVWVASNVQRSAYKLYEFAHGGTQPVAIIDVPRPHAANGCAVDPSTGNIAAVDPAASVLVVRRPQ